MADERRTDLTLLKVNLIPAARKALEDSAELMGDTRTDTVNRALQVYWTIAEAAERASGTTGIRAIWKRSDGRDISIIVEPPS